MAKIGSDHLFTLIKSLSKAEKRHFKVYSSKRILGSQNIYFRLFDEIEGQRKYDEDRIRRQTSFKDLPTLKKRLYKAILVSLSEFHSGTGIDVRDMLNHIEILFDKSLFNHCGREIRKVKKIIERNELYEEWLLVLKWEYKIAVKKTSLRASILAEEKKILSLLDNQKKYRDAANLFLVKYQQYGAERSPRYMKGMKNIISYALLKDERKALSFNAKQNFYDCHALFSLIKGDYTNSYHFGKKGVDLYLTNPGLITSNSFSYLVRINNFLLACLEIKRYQEMLVYLDQLEKTRNTLQSPSERATAFFYLYHLLNYCINTGQFAKLKEEVKRIELELEEHDIYLNQLQQITLYAVISQAHFILENYKRSLFWLKRALSFGEIQRRADLECFIRLFHLIVHYELKSDPDLMGSLLRSTYRFLRKHEHLYKFETAIMDFFRKYILRGDSEQNMKKSFSSLKKTLEELSADPYEKQAFSFFDFISWLESKIENRSFAEVVKERAVLHND